LKIIGLHDGKALLAVEVEPVDPPGALEDFPEVGFFDEDVAAGVCLEEVRGEGRGEGERRGNRGREERERKDNRRKKGRCGVGKQKG
jgi:hypothetical protein